MLGAGAAAEGGAATPPARTIVLVVLDTVRKDHLSLYGYPRDTSPNLRAIAAQGRVYRNAYSVSSWTPPAHASIFTGLYPAAHGATQENWTLAEELETLAERLSDSGYRTFAVVENPMLSREAGFAQGFEVYVETWKESAPPASGEDPAVAAFREWIEEWKGQPLFAFVNLIEPHNPYTSSGPFIRAYLGEAPLLATSNEWPAFYSGQRQFAPEELRVLRDLYDAELLYTDHVLGHLVRVLEQAGLWARVSLIVTSDHGENLGEHGHVDHVFSLYETTLRVPLVIRAPGQLSPGTADDRKAQLPDLFPTVLELAGVEPAASHGRSLLRRWWRGRSGIVAEYYRPLQAFSLFAGQVPERVKRFDRRLRVWIENGWKLIWASDGLHELYDLRVDPGELDNLANEPEYRDQLDRLSRALERHLKRLREAAPRTTRERKPLDPKTIEALRSLGYLK